MKRTCDSRFQLRLLRGKNDESKVALFKNVPRLNDVVFNIKNSFTITTKKQCFKFLKTTFLTLTRILKIIFNNFKIYIQKYLFFLPNGGCRPLSNGRQFKSTDH